MTVVHVLRHGEVHNPEGVLYGRIPGYHLSDHGRAQAMVTRCLGGGEVRLREEKSYCHQFVQK